MTLQEKVELLYIYHRLKSASVVACHFKINKCSIRTIVKKEISEAVFAAVPADTKPCILLTTFLSCTENAAFMWLAGPLTRKA